jgi:hypothetical protein
VPEKIRNVFISHIHEDDQRVQDLKALLESKGYEIRDGSIDSSKPNQAQSEAYIKGEILAPRIRWAGAIVVLIGPDTHTSKYVEWEIEYAQQCGKRIIGVWAQGAKDSDLPKNLEMFADAMVGWQGDCIIEAINGTDTWTTASGKPHPERIVPRYSCSS